MGCVNVLKVIANIFKMKIDDTQVGCEGKLVITIIIIFKMLCSFLITSRAT